MTTIQAIKQLEERNVASEIVLMVWSDRMDLVALANIKGEVALHRLTWTKAWSLNPPKEGLTVKSISWRPDGKVIAIGYDSGQIILVKVENKDILHSFEIKGSISCLNWIQDRSFTNEDSRQSQYLSFIDLSGNFLPEPVQQQFESTNTEENLKTNLLQEQNDLNLLLIGTADGFVYVQIFGCFPAAVLDLNNSVEALHLSENFKVMLVTVKDTNNNVKIVSFNSELFTTHTNELFSVAHKYIKLTTLINYLANTITTITESWESILLEMDIKLKKYANKVPEGGVTADFLDLLMFGICSDEMKEFLIVDLTKKGLEKFGQTIEMSYTNIQKLVLKYVMKFGQNVTYHLAELRGMARLEHRYKVLGLSESAITTAIQSNGAFLIKGGEMQQIINHSIINYKAFFRWLYTAIIHVLEEPVPTEIPKMTQQDLAYITEFLQNFDKIGRKGFIMERLGQYLSDACLTIQPDMSGNEWSYFLSQNQCVQDHESILKHYQEMSLIQQYKHLTNSVNKIFEQPRKVISEQFKISRVFDCFQHGCQPLKMSQINTSKDSVVVAFVKSPKNVFLLQISIDNQTFVLKKGQLFFTHDVTDNICDVIDAKLYSPTVVSVLLQENTTLLCQIPLGAAIEKFTPVEDLGGVIFNGGDETNGSYLQPRLLKSMEGMIGAEFAVSGCRKVGIVLAENRRKVRLYEMEGEEEEDEDAEMTLSAIKEGDMSV